MRKQTKLSPPTNSQQQQNNLLFHLSPTPRSKSRWKIGYHFWDQSGENERGPPFPVVTSVHTPEPNTYTPIFVLLAFTLLLLPPEERTRIISEEGEQKTAVYITTATVPSSERGRWGNRTNGGRAGDGRQEKKADRGWEPSN